MSGCFWTISFICDLRYCLGTFALIKDGLYWSVIATPGCLLDGPLYIQKLLDIDCRMRNCGDVDNLILCRKKHRNTMDQWSPCFPSNLGIHRPIQMLADSLKNGSSAKVYCWWYLTWYWDKHCVYDISVSKGIMWPVWDI